MRWPLRVRSYLVVLVLAALVPVVTFAAVAIVRLARLERTTSEQGMRETARALSLAIDRELASARAALLFLAVSPHVRAGDLEAFHRQALDAISLRGAAIVLAEPSGGELAAGYQRHLAKPVDPADLVDAVVDLADRAAKIVDGLRTMKE